MKKILVPWMVILLCLSGSVLQVSGADMKDRAQRRAAIRLQRQQLLINGLEALGLEFIEEGKKILEDAGRSPIKDVRERLARNHAQHEQSKKALRNKHQKQYIAEVVDLSPSVKLPSIHKGRASVQRQ